MAAEIKVIFEGLNTIKKKIEEGFKSGIDVTSKADSSGVVSGKVPKSFITGQVKLANQLKQNVDALNKFKSSLSKFKDMEKIQEISNKIMKENNKIGQIDNNLKKITKGKVGVIDDDMPKKGGKGGMKSAVVMGAVMGLMGQLVQSTKSIQFIMQFVGGLLDMLIGPLIPILLTLLKPFLTIFMFLAQFMLKFFMDPVAALQDLFTGVIDAIKNIAGFGGKDKQKGAVAGVGAVGGAGIGAIVGGPLGALIGAVIGPLILSGAVARFITGIVEWFSGIWDVLSGIVTLDWERIKEGLGKMWDGLWKIITTPIALGLGALKTFGLWLWKHIKKPFNAAWEKMKGFADWLYDGMKDASKTFGNALISGLNGIIKFINKALDYIPGVSSISKIPKIKDGVVNPAGKIVSVDPKDYLLASKNPRDLMGGNSGNNIKIDINIQGGVDRTTIEQLKRELRRELSSKGAF